MKKALSVSTAVVMCFSLLGTVPKVDAKQETAPIYQNAKSSVEKRVSDLLARMTIEEKVGQMIQAERGSVTPEDVKNYSLGSILSGGGSYPEGKAENSTRDKWSRMVDAYQDGALASRLGIPLLYGVDAVHGHNNLLGATIFPHSIGLGAARDPKLVEKIGKAAAEEVKSSGPNWTFAPTVVDAQNIRWGRTYESFGEDPKLVAEMGKAYIKGLQGDKEKDLKKTSKVVATAKHFIGEGYTKDGVNQGDVTQYTEDEILAKDKIIYKTAVDSGVRTVMASFNSIQGLKMHANKRLMTDVLKNELHFTGFVVSDWYGIQQITKDQDGHPVSGLKQQIKTAVNAGVDMMMQPENWKETYSLTLELVKEKEISMSRLDDAVSRILRVKFEAGVFEHPKTDKTLAKDFGSAEHRKIARQAVSESLVLLKNDKVNNKPIMSQLGKMKNILVAGRSADDIGKQSGGWTISWQGKSGNITKGTTILEGIKQAAGRNQKITYNKHGRGAKGKDAAIVVVGEEPYAESNGDTNNLNLNKLDLLTIENIRKADPKIPIIVVLVSGRPMIVTDQMKDWAGLVEAWLPGTEGEGVADVLFGKKDFTGKLSVKWPFYLEAYQMGNMMKDYIMFDYGYGLKKNQATPKIKPAPVRPEPAGLPVPGKIEAENYTNQNGLQTEDSSEGTKDVGWADGGDWLEYNIDVAEDGLYQADFRYAANLSGETGVNMIIDDAKIAGKLRVTSTGGYQNWKTQSVTDVPLKKGKHKLKLEYINGALNLNWLEFKRTGDIPVTPPDNGGGEKPDVIKKEAVENWVTTERDSKDIAWYFAPRYQQGDKLLQKETNLDLTKIGESKVPVINLDSDKTYQEVQGIGSSMEESTIFNLSKMSLSKREELLKKLADKENGIGISQMRLTIGTADFTARKFYTYDDMPKGKTDVNLENFSIKKDIDYKIIDTVKQIQKINPDVKFFASPWSPPGWMKTSDSIIRGKVKDEYLPVLAKYYLKYLQAYKAQGINIDALTLQNEPLLEIDYPSTYIPWQQEAELAKLLRKELDANGFKDVKLWIFDHNPGDTMAYPAKILADKEAYEAVDGTAFHDYGGDLGEMTKLHNLYPEKNVYLTERAVWGTSGADRIAQYFRNYAKSYNSWVTMLDSDINTHQWVGTPDPTLLVQDSADRNNYWLTPEYYIMGQFSKFVKPGYTRIDSNYGSSDGVTNVAFISPDKKTIVVVVINQTVEPQTFKLIHKGTQFKAQLPAKSVGTYQWNIAN
ncbi:glycoside hydrolase family 3 N-terminal domain-containing protein [Metabacillus sp. RGM 3146]|uniref:glycoside hydrolase family 3 N-terminal domain-containing protein n=1 Tax=Metabacillus sp. RGM 3146 TaxID=3401092 RepID=UPI003B9BBDC6